MAKQSINVGTSPNDNRGDSLRASFQKINANFTELYTALGLDVAPLNLGAFEFVGSTLSTTDSTAIVIDQAVTVSSNLTVGGDVLPSVALGGDLGSSARPWRSLYVSNNTIFLGGTALSVNGAGNLLVNGSLITGGTTSYNDLTNKPTIPTSFDRLVNGAYELVVETDGIISSVAFPERDGGKVYISGVEVIGAPSDPADTAPTPLILTSQQGNVRIKSNALGPMFEWRFGTDGSLILPGDIKSNGNINIEVNLTDSTLHRWQFGEDGMLTLPNGLALPGGAGIFGSGGGYQITDSANSSYFTFDAGGLQLDTYNGSNIRLRTTPVGTSDYKDWIFNSNGNLSFPDGSNQNTAWTGSAQNIASESDVSIQINLTDSTLRRWQFGEDGDLTFPNGVLKIAGNTISNYVATEAGASGSQLEVSQTKTVITNGVTNSLGGVASLTGQSLFEVSTNGILSSFQVINSLGEGDLTLTSEYLTELDNLSFKIGQRVTNDLGDGSEPLVAFSGWTFSTVNQQLALTFPDDTVQTTAWTGIANALRSEGNINIDINLSDSTLRRWQFGEDGSLTLPSVGKINNGAYDWTFGSTGNTTFPTGLTLGAPRGVGTVNFTAAVDKEFQIETGTATSGKLWQFGTDGSLKLPGDIRSNGNINIDINLTDSTLRRWQFGEDGHLTLPSGGNISEGGGLSGAIRLTPAGGANANQALLIYPTAGAPEGDHIHLTTGGGSTELYLGNDYHYVKLVDGGNVEVKATTANFSDTAAWTFGTDGSLTSDDEFIIKAPDGVPTSVYDYSGGGGWNSPPYTNRATTTNGSGTGLTVNVSAAVGGYIDINAITINTAGTGYKTGDIITITNENNLTGTFAVGVAGTNSWTFNRNGALTLPNGAVIKDTGGDAVAFGKLAGWQSQSTTAIAVGSEAGRINQSANAVAIGTSAGDTTQGIGAVAVGNSAGYGTQSADAIAVGSFAGQLAQGQYSIAIGSGAGNETQSAGGIALGFNSGRVTQGAYSIAIGTSAGATNQATDSIAIGRLAGQTNQHTSTIILNATGSALNSSSAIGLFVAPIKELAGTHGVLQYNTGTKEVTYGNSITVNSNTWTFGTDGLLTLPGDIQTETALDITTNHIPYYSNQFSGSQYISIANSASLQLGNATAWTIEAWVYMTAYPVSGTGTIIEKDAQVAVSYQTYMLNIASDGRVAINTGSGDGGHNNPTGKSVVSSTVLPLNQWVHLAAVWNGSNITLYQNGVSVGTVSAATTPITGEGGRAVNIGREDYLNYFTGKISNVRIVKNTAVYTGAFTPSTAPLTAIANTSLLTCNASTINVGTGTATVINESPFGTYGDKTWAFGTDGALTLPIGVSIDSSVSSLYPKIIADSGKLFSVQGQGSTGSAALAWSVNPNTDTKYAAVGVWQGGGDNLAKVVMTAGNTTATLKVWKLDETGAFTFPDNTVQTTAWTGTTTGAITAERFNTDQITIVGNRISTTVTNANLELEGNGSSGVVINTIAEATTASTSRAVGYLGLPQASSNLTQTLTIAESGKHVYISTAGQTITIPAASSVPYRIGTTITFIAGPSATTVTIAINTDTLRLAGSTSTGTRTLAANGMATAVKVDGQSSAGVWYINGTGLT